MDIFTQNQIEHQLARISRELEYDELTSVELQEVLRMLENVLLFINPDKKVG